MKKKNSKKQTSETKININIFDIASKLLPLAKAIAMEILEETNPEPVKKKKKSRKNLDYRHDLCKCGKVKVKSSKYCKDCFRKRRAKK